MKRRNFLVTILTVFCFCLMGIGILTACSGGGSQKGLTFKTLTVNGTEVYGKVGNEVTTFSFINEIKTRKDITYTISLDLYGLQEVTSKTIPLHEGNNTVYIVTVVGGEIADIYTVTIRRNPIYTITFDSSAGTAVASQRVEEGSYAQEPTNPIRAGYDFQGWGFDFSKPITSSVTLWAQWARKPEMSMFNFTSQGTYCKINRIEDKNVTEIIIPDYVTEISHFAFENCRNLTKVVIGSGVNSIGCCVFSGCNQLQSVTFKDTSTWYRTQYTLSWENKSGGMQIDVSNAFSNAQDFLGEHEEDFMYKY